MDEPTAWLLQARADWSAAEHLAQDGPVAGGCHAVAKWQQTVEKAFKAMIAALYDARILPTNYRPRHEVEIHIGVLIRLPRATTDRAIRDTLSRLLDQKTRADIQALDALAPRFPPERNTEYPFQDDRGDWTYPAAPDVFSPDDIQRFRGLAYRILQVAERIALAPRRRPRRD